MDRGWRVFIHRPQVSKSPNTAWAFATGSQASLLLFDAISDGAASRFQDSVPEAGDHSVACLTGHASP
eukprot:12400847-Karenia_brevis.AAC.1